MTLMKIGIMLGCLLCSGTAHTADTDMRTIQDQIRKQISGYGRTVSLAVQPAAPLSNGKFRVVITVPEAAHVGINRADGPGCGDITSKVGRYAPSPLTIEAVAGASGECTLTALAVDENRNQVGAYSAGFVVVNYNKAPVESQEFIKNYKNPHNK